MADPGDAGTITVDRWGAVCPIVSEAAETRTLAQPTKAGMSCLLVIDAYVGAVTVTVTGGYNQAAATDIIMGTAGDWVQFVSVKVGTASYYWRVVKHEGTNLADTGGGTLSSQTITTLNTTALTATNANSTLAIMGTANATNSTISALTATNANSTLAIMGTANATNSTITTLSASNVTAGRMQVTASAITAAGSNQSSAAATNYGMNIVTGSNNAAGVQLPATVANGRVEVLQTVNNAYLLIYPAASSTIAGLSANAALNTGLANTAATGGTTQNTYFRFLATNATQWHVSK
jgi:hypothetical protein